MNFKQFFSVILRKYALILVLLPAFGQAAGVNVLVEDEDGPLILSNGTANAPEGVVVMAPRVFVAQKLRRLWAEVNPFPNELISNIARAGEAGRLNLITGGNIAIRNYPGVHQRTYDRLRAARVPGYRPPTPPKTPAAIHRARLSGTPYSQAAASKIQAGWRGYKSRRTAMATAQERRAEAARMEQRQGAASTIQSAWRRKKARDDQQHQGFLARLFSKSDAREERRMARQVEGMDDSAHGDIVTLERRLAKLKQERADYNMAQAMADKEYRDVERARASARRAMAKFDQMGPSRFEQAIADWKMRNKKRRTGWYKRMLEDLRGEFPQEVRAELKGLKKGKPGKYEGQYVH